MSCDSRTFGWFEPARDVDILDGELVGETKKQSEKHVSAFHGSLNRETCMNARLTSGVKLKFFMLREQKLASENLPLRAASGDYPFT